jgi:hypothetical protein
MYQPVCSDRTANAPTHLVQQSQYLDDIQLNVLQVQEDVVVLLLLHPRFKSSQC